MKGTRAFDISTRRMCMMGVLTALAVVLARVGNIQLGDYLRINFGFLPVAVAGLIAGPVYAAMVGAIADVLGMVLFPSGSFFLGFTLIAALNGVIYGLFLYRKDLSLPRTALCLLTVVLISHILLNTLCLYLLYGKAVLASFWVRTLKNIIQYPINVALLYGAVRVIKRMPSYIRSM